jgi:2-polyprenyl-6-methoxyphenol hydroxylase-like FAD-dependent oxidoreductase
MVRMAETLDPSRRPSTGLQVLVVGGGVGGLCLAQGLKRRGIDIAVYDRDSSPVSRGQGYRISLKLAGTEALRRCVPEWLFELCVATSIRPATRMVFLDQHLRVGKLIPLAHSSAAPSSDGFGVNRLTLREILLTGLDDVVCFDKAFVGHQQCGDGRVRADFADGTNATADLLVGADGSRSAVRAVLLPNAELDDLHPVIYGKTPIGAKTLDWLPDALIDTFNHVRGRDGLSFGVATCRTWEPVPRAVARIAPHARLSDMPGYLAWTLAPAPAHDPTTGGELQEQARTLLEGWHPAVQRIVDEAETSAIMGLTVQSARPVAGWDTPNVTLLGDAIHTMSPGRGEGANVALRDAASLCDALVAVAPGRVPLAEAKAHYESEMLRYGFQAVADSRDRPFLRPLADGDAGRRRAPR